MKIIYRLLAWVIGVMTLSGFRRDYEILSREWSSSAPMPRGFPEAIGGLTASVLLLLLTFWFAKLSLRKNEN